MKRFPASVSCHLAIVITLSACSVTGLASEGTLFVGWSDWEAISLGLTADALFPGISGPELHSVGGHPVRLGSLLSALGGMVLMTAPFFMAGFDTIPQVMEEKSPGNPMRKGGADDGALHRRGRDLLLSADPHAAPVDRCRGRA